MNILKSIIEVNDVIKKDFVIVIAKSHTCGACQSINTVLNSKVVGIENVESYTVFIDDLDQFRGDYLIFSVPTVLVFSDGKELLRESRYINYEKISRLIQLYHS